MAVHVGCAEEKILSEFDLLCACAGVELNPGRVARIADWNRSAIDWDRLLHLAEHHGVLPLVARNLRAHARDIPTHVEQFVTSAYDKNLRRNLWFANELIRITDEFEKKQIRVLSYKGPLLAELAYGDVALRNFGDLDFLIPPSDFERAKQGLAELGYRPSSELRSAVERYWLRNGYERSFDSAAGKYLVEIQWALLPRFYAVDIRTDDLLVRSRPMSMGGREVLGFSPEDLLLVLCLHAAKHLWMRLIWICDIAETIRTQTMDWTLFRERAADLGVLRMVGISFWLARRLLECRLPDLAGDFLNRDSEVPTLGVEFVARAARSATYDFESTEYFRWILKLRERGGDQSRYLWRLVWTPGDGDLAAMKLPEAMFPLYRAVRVARLMRKFL